MDDLSEVMKSDTQTGDQSARRDGARYDVFAYLYIGSMLRRKSSSTGSATVTPVAYRQLAQRLEETEQLLSTLMLSHQQLQRQNQELKQELYNFSQSPRPAPENPSELEGKPTVSLPMTARARIYTKASARSRGDAPQKGETEQWSGDQPIGYGSDWLYWVLTLLIAATAGIGTFYLVQPLVSSRF